MVKKRLIIWAGSLPQAEAYAKSHNLKRDDFTYMWAENILYGVQDRVLIKTGTWYEKTDIREEFVKEYAASHNITIKEDSI